MSSMKEVALLAGVSPSTVSRVINGTMHVNEETKRKVEEAIAIVNYKPNLLAQGLRLKSTKNIGLLVPEIAHSAFDLVVKYTEESATARGLNMLLFNTHNDYRREAVAIDMLLRQKINGIIFSRVSDESQVVNIQETTETPIVVIDRVFTNEKIPNVILNNYQAGVLAAKHMIACGCRRMACITGSYKITLSRERFNGFRDTLEQNGIAFDPALQYEGSFTYDAGVEGVEYFLSKGLTFDGIWGENDLTAAGAISTLLRRGIRVPEDVSVMGMDDVPFTRMFYPSISTVGQPYAPMCEKAISFIEEIASGKQITEYQALFEPYLVVRESTRGVQAQ